MTELWLTRDRDSETVILWDKLPIFKDGAWDRYSPVASAVSPINTQAAEILLGDLWCDDGAFCVQINIDSITRVLSRPQKLVNKLRAMTRDTCCSKTLLEAADLIEVLSQK